MPVFKRGSKREREVPQDEEQAAVPASNEELENDVACCLADIDEVLEEQAATREDALRDYESLQEMWKTAWIVDAVAEALDNGIREFNLKYAHLGYRVRQSNCCSQHLILDGA